MNLRILLVEDEPGLVLTVSDLLSTRGYSVETALDGEDGYQKALSRAFDLIVLDVMLPKMSGFDVCRELRRRGVDTAILMLTARTQVVDRVNGLKTGADDYLAKPFDPEELLARVEALIRRVRRHQGGSTVRFGDVNVDFDSGKVQKNGSPVSLATKELQLLRYLVDQQGKVVAREELLQNVWEYQADVASRTIDVHVAWLRQKLEDNPQSPRHIHTIRGKGYRFSA